MVAGRLFAHLTNMGSVNEFLHQKLALYLSVFWFSYLLPLFGFINAYFSFRLRRDDSSLNYTSSSLELNSEENDKTDSSYVMKEEPKKGSSEEDGVDYRDSETDVLCEKETNQFCFSFKFPTFEEYGTRMRDNGDSVSSEAIPSASTNKYEFMSKKSFSAFIEDLEPISFRAEEINTGNGGSFEDGDIDDDEEDLSTHKDSNSLNLEGPEAEPVRVETDEKWINGASAEELNEKKDSLSFTGEKGEVIVEEKSLHVPDEKEGSSSMDSDLESDGSSHLHAVISHLVDSFTDGFLSDGEFGGAFEFDHLMEINGHKVEESHEEMLDLNENQEFEDFDEEDSDIMEELRNLEEDHIQESNKFKSNFLSDKDFHDNYKYGASSGKNDMPANSSDNSEIPEGKNDTVLDSEDTNKLETLWEHQELIEQLKMELKRVRATGLPTILEESESPKIMEDLKPWKIDEKFQHENPIGEFHKFYKSYRERMRKFDILNYQKMYAIGFLQLKDPLQSIPPKKTLVPDITSILPENFSLYKSKKNETDPMKKFINELWGDLEVVYVGQMCLSWEVLHWQYGMALDLWESDPRGIGRYNEVAGEFQQFQVLVQRFIEDEPFQGPRVQNYIKHRCVLRNLLQVPVIREDISKDRKKARSSEKGDYSITSDMLVEIVEESIRIFWHFVCADKDCTSASRKGLKVELQDPADSEILKEARTDLQKKERRLKDQLRSGNSILKKFQKYGEEDNSDQVLFFFSQVDMKLVSRVLNMSRLTTDQLAWCRSKLNTISYINRRIHVEPSFCLFPC